jgi:hypothetical protein
MMDTLRSYVNSLSNRQAANIVNKWLYKIMLSQLIDLRILIKAALFDCKIRNIAFLFK